ncbi:MAG: peptide chain release factor N(5)-glutamine methyltransferase [Armatimonadota bacterium]
MTQATLGELVAEARAQLRTSGVEQPEREAWLLLAHVLGAEWPGIRMRRAEQLPPWAQRRFESLVRRRAAREPLQYVTGETEFMGLTLRCRPGVFIPRPETEVLVECVLERVRGWGEVVAADIGCGTGNIACALAHFLPQARVEAFDRSTAAVELAEENATAVQLADRIHCHVGAFLDPLAPAERRALSCVVCNPPYVRWDEFARLQPEVLAEPRDALDGGQDGLCFYREFIPMLNEVGGERLVVAFEVGRGQAPAVARMLGQAGKVRWTEVRRDYAGIERVVLGGTEEAR